MPTNTTPLSSSAETVRTILIRESKLRDWKVFEMELKEFLKSDMESYYFLSEDYYEHHLVKNEDGSLKLSVSSEKPEILERTESAQHKLEALTSSL